MHCLLMIHNLWSPVTPLAEDISSPECRNPKSTSDIGCSSTDYISSEPRSSHCCWCHLFRNALELSGCWLLHSSAKASNPWFPGTPRCDGIRHNCT